MTNPTVTIGLLWHSMSSDNLGVGALTVAHMAILEETAKAQGLTPRFIVIGWADPRPPYFKRPNLDIVQLRMRDFVDPRGLWRSVRRCDLVLDIGAGDSFADIYGVSRISKMIAAQNIVMAAGRPLVLSPQTIGPFSRPWVRRLALNVMRRARAVATRDRLSTSFAREMGYDGQLIEATDVALRLPHDAPEPRPEGPVRVGLNISGLLMNGGYTRNNMFGLTVDYPALMRAAVALFHHKPEVELHLVGHVLASSQPVEDDRAAGETLAKEFPGVIVAPGFQGPSDAKSYIAGMDFFAGARMHACIAAFSTGVPVLPIAYSRKFAGLFGTLGYERGADCKAEDQETILTKLDDAYVNRAQLKAEVDAALAHGLDRLKAYEDAIAGLISNGIGVDLCTVCEN